MQHFLHAVVTFPGAVYTALLGVVVLYWLSMLAGAVDLDLLGGADHGGGAADGAMHGDGVGHGHADVGDADGGDGGDADGDGDGGDADSDGGVLSALGALGLRRVPMTLSVSLLVIWGWLITVLGTLMLEAPAAHYLPAAAFKAILLVVAMLASLKLASVTARPIAPVFQANKASRREHLVGKLAEVSTGRLDARFGQVLVGDGGAGLLIDARHEGGETLKRGDRVIVTSWDADKGYVLVEPVDQLTTTRVDARNVAENAGEEAPPKSGDAAGKRVLR